jgi:hypothetical protein
MILSDELEYITSKRKIINATNYVLLEICGNNILMSDTRLYVIEFSWLCQLCIFNNSIRHECSISYIRNQHVIISDRYYKTAYLKIS